MILRANTPFASSNFNEFKILQMAGKKDEFRIQAKLRMLKPRLP